MDVITRERSPATSAYPSAPGVAAVKTVNLALQGGGAHGAFAWGVLDRLLEDERMVMQKLSVMSKLNADWEFLTHLRDDGRAFAGRWLGENFERIGIDSTIDIQDRYL
jgi:hypothetical protein